MNEIKSPVRLFIVLSVCSFFACVLSLIELSDILFYFRPDWLVLVVFYWVLALPRHVNTGYGFLNGLLLDVVLVKPLGFNAIGFVVLTYFVGKGFSQIRVLSLWQQCLLVGLLTAIFKLVVSVAAVMSTDFVFTYYYWYSIISNMLFWPIIFGGLRYVRRAFLMDEKR